MHQQEFDRARELFPRALKEGKLMEYLGGFPGYRLFDPYADSPTDPNAAFTPMRDLIVGDIAFRTQVFDALCRLAKDKDYGWMAIYYFSELRYLETSRNVDLLTTELVNAVADNLRENKEFWDMNTKWVGQSNRGGLWGAVKGMNKVIADNYNLSILPEELEPTSPNPEQP